MVCLLSPRHLGSLWLVLLGPIVATAAQAQSIVPANTTTVQQGGSQYQIDGGTLSSDRTTLVHSFDQFGLLTGEAAQFSNPATVETIIGRVLGGDASLIDGLLSVEGAANLYLLNPSGIFFGENTQLNLSGSFSASTATGLSFSNGFLDTLGTNDDALNGAPTGYIFGGEQASAVVNTGRLVVSPGQSLTLLGGQVMNTGQLIAPNGEILAMAVPGESWVQLNQPGSLLGLQIEPFSDIGSGDVPVTTLPALLTGAQELGMATEITVEDGTVRLSGGAMSVPMEGATTLIGGQLVADGGNIAILGDRIALVGATVDASGATAGGTVLMGGDELGNGSVPNATATVIDATSVVRADAREVGDGGKIVAWGTRLLRTAGQLSARGGFEGGDGGFIETSSLGDLEIAIAPDVSAPNGLGGLWLLDPTNIRIVAGTTNANITDDIVGETNIFDSAGSPEQEALLGVELILAALAEAANVEIRTTGTEPGEGNITLETPLDYDDIDGTLGLFAAGAIEIQADILDSEAFFRTPALDFPAENVDSLDLTLEANGPITIIGDIDTGGGRITIESLQDDIDISGQLTTSAGDIDLTALQGAITVAAPMLTSEIRTSSDGGELSFVVSAGGNVTLEAQDAIAVDEITTSSGLDVAGAVFIQSSGASVNTGSIDTSSAVETSLGSAGDVTLKALDSIVFNSIDTSNDVGDAGQVFIESETDTVRGTDLVPGSPATILAEGAAVDGTITIAHDGGRTGIPFDLGDASVNGTAGALSTRAVTLADGDPDEPFLGSFEVENIEIITSEAPDTDIESPTTDIPGCVTDCSTSNQPDPLPTEDDSSNPKAVLKRFERKLTDEMVDYLTPGLVNGENLPTFNGQLSDTADLSTIQANLLRAQTQTGKRPALIYAVFGANNVSAGAESLLRGLHRNASLELLLITAEGQPKYLKLPATRSEVLRLAQRFRRQVAALSRVNTTTYLQPAQQLYQLLVAPLEAELNAQNIDTISFVTDAGLRSMPLAALHDGNSFIIQNYNIGLMPSLSLTDLTYQDLRNVAALVAGTSTFANQASLPGVPVELEAISTQWRSKVLQDDAFSLMMLTEARRRNPYGIIHLATHGEFNGGDLSQSYLYLRNERLRLNQLRTLGLNRPAVELLTLSACQTALGNRSAELGFAGFAILAGAKTSVASLWNVSDEASVRLMIEFYRQLQTSQPVIKAEALRAAQLAMLGGNIRLNDDQRQILAESGQLAIEGQQDFTHPYYWAAFSLVGSPW